MMRWYNYTIYYFQGLSLLQRTNNPCSIWFTLHYICISSILEQTLLLLFLYYVSQTFILYKYHKKLLKAELWRKSLYFQKFSYERWWQSQLFKQKLSKFLSRTINIREKRTDYSATRTAMFLDWMSCSSFTIRDAFFTGEFFMSFTFPLLTAFWEFFWKY